MSSPLRRITLSTQVADELRRRIIDGRYAGGEQLRQEALAADLGVSRIPVREALRQLDAEGWVCLESHRGATVTTLTHEQVGELFELRLLIEPWLVRHAVAHMDATLLVHLERLAREMRGLPAEEWGNANWEFHRLMYAPAARPASLDLLAGVHQRIDRFVRLQVTVTKGMDRVIAEHRGLVALCRKADPGPLARELERHIQSVADDLHRHIDHPAR